MATLSEIRAQYPQYGDMSDGQLADALHARFYADMPRADFNAKIGLAADAPPVAPASGSGMLANLGAGLDQSLYNTLGAPVDAASWAVNKGLQGVEALTGYELPDVRDDLPGSSKSIAGAFSAAGVPDPQNIVAATPEERVARGAGEGVGYTVGPQAMVGALTRAAGPLAPRTMDALGKLTGQTSSAARTAGNAVAGGAAGAGATIGTDMVDGPWKGLAGLGGGLVGGGLGTLAVSVPSLARATGRVAQDFANPFTVSGRERAAGREIWAAADDPQAARQALDTMPDELVPGSRPTTFQATGDLGLGGLERRVQTQSPEAFAARRGEQNSARIAALSEIQPGGHPEAVSKAFRDRLSAIDDETERALSAAAEAARGRTAALGGNQAPEAYGDAARSSLRDAETTARAQEKALWQAVDPENRLDVGTSNASQAARRILADVTPYTKPFEGEAASLINLAAQMPETVRFGMASELRSRISTAMRNELRENGQSATYARLTQLRGAVQDDLSGLIAQRADEDARAVAAGAMSEEQTMAAKLARQFQEWKADAGQSAARADLSGHGRGTLAGGSSRVLPVARAQGQGVGGPRNAPGAAGPFQTAGGSAGGGPNSVGLPFDAAAGERLAAATQATKDRAQTFGRGTNSQILRRSGQDGPYELASASVPGRLFFPGSASGQRIAEYRAAVGDEQALPVIQDYAAAQLRKAAERPDGTLDPARLAGWRRNHADALRAFPDLDARFADAGRASEAMAEAATTRRVRLDDYQKGMTGRLIGAQEPADVTRMVGGVFGRQDAATAMKSLADSVKGEPAAREGLRKAVADYIAGRFVGNTEAATTGQGTIKSDGLQTFVAQNQAALRHVFNDDEFATLTRIAVDIQRSNRSLYAVKIPGQSNTAQDVSRIQRDDGFGSILGRALASSGAGGVAGFVAGGPAVGLAMAIGTGGVSALRQHGVRRIEDLVRDAMLDPALAKVLLQKTPASSAEGIGRLIASRYRASAFAGELSAEDESPPGLVSNTNRATDGR